MSVSVRQNQPKLDPNDLYDFPEAIEDIAAGAPEGVDPAYQELIEKEDKFDADAKAILEFIQLSDMQDLSYDENQKLDLDMLRNWKSMYGKIYASRVTDDPVVYVWRPLLRLEYKQMIGTPKEPGSVDWTNEFMRQEAILKKCLMFPKPTYQYLMNVRAGVPSALEQQILFQSGFVNENVAIQSIQILG